MKKIKKILSSVLVCAAALFCGCSGGTAESSDSSSYDVSTTESGAAFTVPPEVSEPAGGTAITYFGTKDISAFVAEYEKTTGGSVIVERPKGDYLTELQEKISSDASPDLCDKVENTYPYLMSNNLYEDLTNYIDISAPQWEDMTDAVEHYSFKGERFFYPTTLKIMPQFLIYVKGTYIQGGNLPDPEKLWINGEWTWDSFQSGAQGVIESPSVPAGTLIAGEDIFSNFLASTGTALFSQVGSRFADGFSSDASADVNALLSDYEIEYTISGNAADAMGETVFISGDESTLAELRKANLAVGAVPYPRGNDTDKYYCKASADGFLVPKGAKNIQSAASFINCSRIVCNSEEYREKENTALIKSGLLRSDTEWLERLRGNSEITPVIVDENCFDSEVNVSVQRLLTYRGDSWKDALSENLPKIDGALETINAVIE